ncbi:hypothetical protein COT30_05480 [Candidatus Micrarchaeota archaeon CG08_land_8_20_14_0_20_49_17]|nr:MAG: hypothetical protein AUJ13_04445 [Candidatus Micrarchaeota archaeon CG1_02_49_24]PIU09231.1 MAG: hypothetical protein COT30_05480 [Candidatus Micrarchaeota archaeon CG08_land_8_20_14_0_20_49_17]PIU81254.1 MAG: hypothetical protein COS70_05050 [Candidatus Micrarchaeota archaeon CG06_land_8_20_14_3_00_50_6]PIZ98530.1 MAG: hypothetical protein COX84_01940 [Candidatus Micrarchaeota archaeon CG_4_10_14_0_2_um_filter_49_7]HII53844.1 hypothetical protein [Candidatus Micrarchaeota archaeon]
MELAFSSVSPRARKTAWMIAGAAACALIGTFAGTQFALPKVLGNQPQLKPTSKHQPHSIVPVPAKPLAEGPRKGTVRPKHPWRMNGHMSVEELLSQPGLAEKIMSNRVSESRELKTAKEQFTYWLAAARISANHMDIDSQRKLFFMAAKKMRGLLYERENGALSRMEFYEGNAGQPLVARVDRVDVAFTGHSIAWHALCAVRGVLLVADEIDRTCRDAVEIVWQLAGAGAGIGSYIRYAAEPMAEALRKTDDPEILRMADEFFTNLGQKGRVRCLGLRDLEFVAGSLDIGIRQTADDYSPFGQRKLSALVNAKLLIGQALEKQLNELLQQEKDESERLQEAPSMPRGNQKHFGFLLA